MPNVANITRIGTRSRHSSGLCADRHWETEHIFKSAWNAIPTLRRERLGPLRPSTRSHPSAPLSWPFPRRACRPPAYNCPPLLPGPLPLPGSLRTLLARLSGPIPAPIPIPVPIQTHINTTNPIYIYIYIYIYIDRGSTICLGVAACRGRRRRSPLGRGPPQLRAAPQVRTRRRQSIILFVCSILYCSML